MDLIVMGIVGILAAIITILIAVFTKKKIGIIIIYGLIGMIIGIAIGYLLAPVIISFI